MQAEDPPHAVFELCASVTRTGFTVKQAAYHASGTCHLRLSDQDRPDPAVLEHVFAKHREVAILRWTNVVGAVG